MGRYFCFRNSIRISISIFFLMMLGPATLVFGGPGMDPCLATTTGGGITASTCSGDSCASANQSCDAGTRYVCTPGIVISSFTITPAMIPIGGTGALSVTSSEQQQPQTGTGTTGSDASCPCENITWTNSGDPVGNDPLAPTFSTSGVAATIVGQSLTAGSTAGTVTITATVSDSGTSVTGVTCPDATESTAATIVELGLTAVSEGNTPDISPNICLNAQSAYTKAKFQAKVLPVGTTATVSVSGVDVTASTTTAQDGDTIEVTGGANTGSYQIQLSLTGAAGYSASGSGSVFSLSSSVTDSGTVTSSTTANGASVTEASNLLQAYVVPNVVNQLDGSDIKRNYNLKIIATPAVFTGNVKARTMAKLDKVPYTLKVRRFPEISGFLSVSAAYGLVSASYSSTGSGSNSIAGVNASVSIEGNASTGSSIQLAASDIPVAFFTGTIKTLSSSNPGDPVLGVTLNDSSRTYQVGTSKTLTIETSASSKTVGDPPVRSDVMDCEVSFGGTNISTDHVSGTTFEITN